MNVLIDTHVALWCLYEPDKLSVKAREVIMNPDNWIYYSRISLWECEIKHSKHPDLFKFDAAEVENDCYASGFTDLELKTRHIYALAHIGEPHDIKHNDPFDRMLMAQAYADNMMFLTHDSRLGAYDIKNVVVV